MTRPRPASMRLRIELLQQLEQLLHAGISALEACEMLGARSLPLPHRRQIAEARTALANGSGLSEAFAGAGGPFAALELAHLQAGELSGKLPEACEAAAERLQAQRETWQTLWMGLAYPGFLLHLAVLFPWPSMGRGGPEFPSFDVWLTGRVGLLAGLYFAGFLLLLLTRWWYTSPTRAETLDAGLLRLPLLGGNLRRLALADLLEGFASLQDAGLLHSQALRQAGRATGNRALGAAAERASRLLEDGESLSLAFASEPQLVVRSEVVQGLRVAETTGDLSGALTKLCVTARMAASRSIKMLSGGFSVACYLGVAVFIGYNVISFYAGYYQGILEIGGG